MYKINSLYVEITSKCNLKCRHCFNDSGIGNEMEYSALQQIVLDAIKMKIPSIVISGGEPLMHSRFEDICLLIKQHGLELLINTNSLLIDKNMMKFLFKNEIYLQISLEGATSNSNDFIRGKGVFNKIINLLNTMPTEYLSRFVHLRMTLTQMSKNEVEDYIDLADKFGIKYVGISRLRAEGRAIDTIDKKYYLTEYDLMEVVSLIKELDVKNVKVGYYDITELGACFIAAESENKNFTPRVTKDGDVYACQMFDDPDIALGNIFNISLEILLSEDRIKQNIERIKSLVPSIDECKSCGFSLLCSNGCLAERYRFRNTTMNCNGNKAIYMYALKNKFI